MSQSTTPDLYAAVRERVLAALADAFPALPAEVLARVEVAPPREEGRGEMASNAAMVTARAAGRKPAEIAAMLAQRLATMAPIAAAEVAGPGFLNLTLEADAWRGIVPTVLAQAEAYGDSAIGGGVAVNVEFVSANPTGPLHVGHCRGAVVGDALANLLAKAGYRVTREFYVNDAGNQVTALAWATYWRYLEALGTELTQDEFAARIPGGLQYGGDYLRDVARGLVEAHGEALAPGAMPADPEFWLEPVRAFAIAFLLETIKDDLARLGIRHDIFSSERALVESGAADRMIAALRERDLIYEGVLEPPKGKLPEDWEPREQTLFRATRFGDDVDRPLRKSDGTATYFANDIAYHADKIARGAEILIDVLGADHGGYLPRMKAAVAAIGGASFEVALCQIVHFQKGGEQVRMSKRAGTFVTVADLLEEVDAGSIRFTMLMRKNDAQMTFDLDLAVAQTRENPVFYVQYAHARARSVLRAAEERGIGPGCGPQTLAALEDSAELAVLRRLAAWPRLVEGAAQAREPHRIAFFLYDLASDFHMLWNRGRDDAALRFLIEDRPAETAARVALVAAVAVVLRSGMAVLGVTPVEEMR
ncbi:MAG: arginine--tRNA ligase [Rhodospirillales bacterium]|nr:arginine--tRNA ligase [Rhodospirillales bacterium]